MPTIRPAEPSEDAALSRVLCNAFLPIWNHNWFQNVAEPLAPVPVRGAVTNSTTSSASVQSGLQSARVGFYLSLIKATRLVGGEVFVHIVDDEDEEVNEEEVNGEAAAAAAAAQRSPYGAILLWLPPHRRMSITRLSALYRSGFLGTMYAYGAVGIYRVNFVFEANIERMFRAAGVDAEGCAMVQMLASNVEWRGRGLASQLLRWRIERFERESEGARTVLDTTTEAAKKVYLKLGFALLGETEVDTGCDAVGVRLPKGVQAGEDVKHVQWIMMKTAQP